MTIHIDPDFRALIPPLSPEERATLEANLQADGCRDPLVVWQGVLLDGHNRYDLCTVHGIPYQTVEQSCADRNAAKAWIIRNQFGRRNLQPFQRVELALVLEPLLAAEGRQREVEGGRNKGVRNFEHPSGNSNKTIVKLGKIAGVGKDAIHRGKVITKHAPEDVKVALRQGTMSINRAYKSVRNTVPSKADRAPRFHMPTLRTEILFSETIRIDVRNRIEQVRDEALTLDQLAKRWKVDPKVARRYVREAALFGEVIKVGDRFTLLVSNPLATLEGFKRFLHAEILEKRKACRDGYHGWRHDNVLTLQQSTLLDWIEDQINTVPSAANVG